MKNFSKLPIMLFFLALPASLNYGLKDYGYGGGGSQNSTSGSYGLFSIVGETNDSTLTGSAYSLGPGLIYTQLANVPTVTISNPSSYYNKLLVVIGVQNNPTDTTYVIGISTDDFVTTYYLQADGTLGATPVYRTYSQWGSGSGTLVTGLLPNTTYKARANAFQGRFSETGFGPSTSAATSQPSLAFDIDIGPTDLDTDPVFSINFGNLTAGSVTTASDKIWIDFSTNADSGGRVYIKGQNAGLTSSVAGTTISSASADLSVASSGFGVQSSSVSQTSGTLSAVSPYNGAAQNVGIVDSTYREIYETSGPLVGGRASIAVMAKPSAVTPAGVDYSETFTMIASATY